MSNPNHAAVRSTLTPSMTAAKSLQALDPVCAAASQCPEVQSSPIAKPAFDALSAAVTTAHTSLITREKFALALIAAAKALRIDIGDVRIASRTFEAAVSALAKGDAALIAKAGLKVRAASPPPATLTKVSVVRCKPGKHPCEAIITWPVAPGATGYGIEVNFTPQNPAGAYTALTSGTGRRRTVKGPTPGCQFLVRIASLGSGGTQADWSDAVLATAL